ncbi:MAG: CIC family chloride channel protein [Pseudoalteromonas tetraodonis]|jgi:CIC family chloride channel protein
MSNKLGKKNDHRFSSVWLGLIESRFIAFVRRGYGRFLEAQQVRMSGHFEGLPLLALLGLLCGVIAGGVIISFRLLMEGAADQILPNGDLEGFEQLSGLARFSLCVAGGLLAGLILHFLKPQDRTVGVVHVIERLDYHQAHLPLKNAATQFVTGIICLISGQSVGREGPSVHLGATAGSALGRLLRVPNNSIRILVGCGVSAAIAAAFNTPLAGVIFAMEVVIMEYTVIGFTPVIIAAVSATTLTRLTFGDDTALTIPNLDINSVQELPIVALMGALIGCLSAGFIQITLITSSLFNNQSIWLRLGLAGVATGLLALALPQIMGTGYDTVDQILLAQVSIGLVLVLAVAKTVATATAIGLGMPAGLIGPTLFIGAAAGSAIGLAAAAVNPDVAGSSYYAMLGMAAMMAATLQAPLAALIYLLELTASQSIILPAMTAVITASLVTRVVFGKSSVYQHLMLARGLDYRNSPLSKALRRIGVASVMERNIIQQPREISRLQATQLLKLEPRWLLLTDQNDPRKTSLLPATDLARHLNELEQTESTAKAKIDGKIEDVDTNPEAIMVDLYSIPAMRLYTASVTIVATLQEAHEKMQTERCEVLYITGAHGESKSRIYGVITREHIESSYRV